MGHIFISYSHNDKDYASDLADDLHHHGFDVWMDNISIGYGERFAKSIETAIKACSAFLVIMSPDAEESDWVASEIILAQDEKKPIFPLLLEGKAFFTLNRLHYADVRGGKMPPEDFYERLAAVLLPPTPVQKPTNRKAWWGALGTVLFTATIATITRFTQSSQNHDRRKTPSACSPLASLAVPIMLVISLVVFFNEDLFKSGNDKKDDSSAAGSVTDVRLQMSWLHTNEYAPMYMADDKGYYANEGLKVELNPLVDAAGNAVNVIDEVMAGRAQFGVMDAGQIMTARAEGKPIVAIMALYQRHPLALVSLKTDENNIISPHDLVGKTVQLTPQSRIIFDALLAAQDIDPASVTVVERTDYSLLPLTSGEADVLDAWVTNEVVSIQQQNLQYNAIFAYEYGVDMYPNLVFTTEEYIQSNPEIVQGFVSATVKGINDTLAEREKAAELTVARDAALNYDVELLSIAQGVPLLVPANGKAGMMTHENWEIAYNILIGEGVLTEPMDYTKAYDMTFLNAIYGS